MSEKKKGGKPEISSKQRPLNKYLGKGSFLSTKVIQQRGVTPDTGHKETIKKRSRGSKPSKSRRKGIRPGVKRTSYLGGSSPKKRYSIAWGKYGRTGERGKMCTPDRGPSKEL